MLQIGPTKVSKQHGSSCILLCKTKQKRHFATNLTNTQLKCDTLKPLLRWTKVNLLITMLFWIRFRESQQDYNTGGKNRSAMSPIVFVHSVSDWTIPSKSTFIHQKYKYVCLSPAFTNLAATDFRAFDDYYNHLNVQFVWNPGQIVRETDFHDNTA